MDKVYFAYVFQVAPELQEALLGLLSELPFESFEEREDSLVAYLPQDQKREDLPSELEAVRERIPFVLEIEQLEYQNWNVLWESNFAPIQVGDFCGIRAEFHPSFGGAVRHELCIQPRMAFGTGHHETTYMMIELMERLPLAGARVLDYGAGTGILAILADQLGAAAVDALEIETIACENALDNCRMNNAEKVVVMEGTLERVVGNSYDIVLANINRHVLLDSFLPLYAMLPPQGLLVISGILLADRELIEGAVRRAGFQIEGVREKGQWLAMQLRRS